jgi:predicted phage terminase large subunit-like protein
MPRMSEATARRKPPAETISAAVFVKGEKKLQAARGRDSFYWFRRLIRPEMKTNWWTDCIEADLQRFYEDLAAGKRPKVAMMAPPQHGKSWAATDFIAWVAGRNPDLKTIFASFSETLGMRTNLDVQRILKSPGFQLAFPLTEIDKHGWVCNTDLIEYVNRRGSFRNTTVNGQINGMELHLGVIDDPVKGRIEANSAQIRERTWAWFADDFLSRFSENSGMLIIMTRWHVDDLLGRFIERYKGEVKILRYPAIAEKRTRYRAAGEALFPQLKSAGFLAERRAMLTEASWQSLYQQHPIVVGGGIFPVEKLTTLDYLDRGQIVKSVRYVDKAGTEGGGAYTALVLMHKLKDGSFVIEHVARGQWAALEREQKIKYWAERDRKQCRPGAYEVVIEQEPGSGGKESAEATIRMLAGFKVVADKVTGSKEVRADPFAAQVQGGNVKLVAGDWHYAFLDELESFPSGKYRDQTDAASGAFNRLVLGPTYSLWTGAFDY